MGKKKFSEVTERSLVKSLTFRAVILLADAIIVFTITHNYDLTIGVIILTNLASTVIYFLHERAWNKIYWGKKPVEK